MSLSPQVAPFTHQASETISGDGDEIVLYAPNSASYLITVEGSFEGSISSKGAAVYPGPEGSRLLFQSGVGGIGVVEIRGYGDAVSREYRAVAGGDYIILRASSWVSGSANVRIHAQTSQNIVFVNGPVHNTFEDVQRAGRAYSAGTSVQSVTADSFLQYRFENPIDSNKLYFVEKRIFSNNRSAGQGNLELSFFPTYSAPLPGASAVTPNNLRPGGASSSALFEWVVSSTSLGIAPLGQILPTGGALFTLTISRILEPGQSFAYEVGGAGGGLNNAARVASTIIWFEEDRQ